MLIYLFKKERLRFTSMIHIDVIFLLTAEALRQSMVFEREHGMFISAVDGALE